jgi:predicted RNA-binding Zn-ribbon protein involved in translation (DUF1610 family)
MEQNLFYVPYELRLSMVFWSGRMSEHKVRHQLNAEERLCPKCQSTMVRYQVELADNRTMLRQHYQCEGCGFVSQSDAPRPCRLNAPILCRPLT